MHEVVRRKRLLINLNEKPNMNGSIVVIEVNRLAKATKHVLSRISKGLCIACPTNPRPHKKRGLCTACHESWRRKRAAMPTRAQKTELDALLMSEGHLLERDEIRELKATDVFSNAAKKISKQK